MLFLVKLRKNYTMLLWAAMAISFFGSRRFLKLLMQQLEQHRPVTAQRLQQLIRSLITIAPHPSVLFTTSFNPNRLTRHRVAKSSNPVKLTCRIWMQFRRKLVGFKTYVGGYVGSKPIKRKALSSQYLQSWMARKVGSFRGRHIYQVLRLSGIRS